MAGWLIALLLLFPLSLPANGSGGTGVVGFVPDGDTLHLEDGRRLRLIGINTPEVERKRKAGEPGGEAAASALRQLAGERVRFEYDQEREDRYGRQLVHLFDQSGRLVNEWLLQDGYAHAAPHPPNLQHVDRYAAAERRARDADRGIWRLGRYQIKDAANASRLKGFQRLRGRVAAIGKSRKYHRLTLNGGLVVLMPRREEELFVAAGKGPERLHHKSLVVRGWVGRGGTDTILRLRHPHDIESIE